MMLFWSSWIFRRSPKPLWISKNDILRINREIAFLQILFFLYKNAYTVNEGGDSIAAQELQSISSLWVSIAWCLRASKLNLVILFLENALEFSNGHLINSQNVVLRFTCIFHWRFITFINFKSFIKIKST